MNGKLRRMSLLPLAALAGAALMTACASAPEPPSDALDEAQSAIYKAEEAGAAEFASLELRTARDKLNAAEAASRGDEEEDMAQAKRLAEEARSSAEVASARADAARAQAANNEIRDGIETLRQEAQRTGG